MTGADHTDLENPDESYVYDENGNRISSHLHGDGYVTGSGNRLLSDGTYDYEYDNEGNMTRRTEIATGDYREFTWDHRNRLTNVNDYLADDTSALEVSFTYDIFDRRLTKTVDSDPSNAISESTLHVSAPRTASCQAW